MRTITLLRHAKSSWEAAPAGEPPRPDKGRPLAPRGRRDAPRMAAWLAAHGVAADLILCSSARRTRETLDLVRAALLAKDGRVDTRDDLYLADAAEIVALARRLPDAVRHVLFIGHDPGLHEAAQLLSGRGDVALRRLLAEKFPTAAAAVVDFAAARWRDIGPDAGTLRLFMAPKRLPE